MWSILCRLIISSILLDVWRNCKSVKIVGGGMGVLGMEGAIQDTNNTSMIYPIAEQTTIKFKTITTIPTTTIPYPILPPTNPPETSALPPSPPHSKQPECANNSPNLQKNPQKYQAYGFTNNAYTH